MCVGVDGGRVIIEQYLLQLHGIAAHGRDIGSEIVADTDPAANQLTVHKSPSRQCELDHIDRFTFYFTFPLQSAKPMNDGTGAHVFSNDIVENLLKIHEAPMALIQ